jgi:hypothetical protein
MPLTITSDDIHYVTGVKVGKVRRCEDKGRVWYTLRVTITQEIPHTDGVRCERELTLFSDNVECLFLDTPEE